MQPDLDVLEFCRNLKNSKKPPYQCPVVECGKVYKSMCGLQHHLVHYDHNAPPIVTLGSGRKKSRSSQGGRNSVEKSGSTVDLLPAPARESLTYAEAQKMVEFEIDGRITRFSIFEPIPIISKEEYEAVHDPIIENGNQIDSRPGHQEEKIKLPEPSYSILESYNISDAPPRPNSYIRFIERSAEEMDGEVEYDMDEEDSAWLTIINERRAVAGLSDVPVDTFELLMDRLEKESYFQMQSNGKGNDGSGQTVIDDDAVCCICMDGECQNSNVILFCDMCNLAVHQDCYGVPYIPEGQWLCRRCLQSPSRAVDCVLCPNNGGAFKQTDRGHWAHVVCALWIPEVRFANTVFLEPIDSIETIPPARWKLTCYICKQRGVGACIQCHKTNCYAAFHVTCAQQAGLFMKMDTVRDTAGNGVESGPVLVQKTAYCDTHTPPEADARPRMSVSKQSSDDGSQEESNHKMKKARRLLAKKRSSVPVISIPTIPPERIQEIASLVNLPKKSQLIQRLIAYWTLKRQFRNGVPLLRRLQSSHLARRDDPRPLQEVVSDAGELYRQLKFWQCIRQDLERARLLCELVRKREKLKKELCKIKEMCLRIELCPRESFMIRLLDLIQAKDVKEIFSEPVDLNEVLDYSDVVKHPMDISTMRFKAENFLYSNLDGLETDFNLMINNCMAYNSRDTIFYKEAIKMREQGGALIRLARQDYEEMGLDIEEEILDMTDSKVDSMDSGLSHAKDDSYLMSEIDKQLSVLTGKIEKEKSQDVLSKLLELLERSQLLKQGAARAKRIRTIKTEIAKLRRKMSFENAKRSVVSENEDGFESDSEHEDTTDDESKVQRKSDTALSRPSTRRSNQNTEEAAPVAAELGNSLSKDLEVTTEEQTPTTLTVPGKRGRRRKSTFKKGEDSIEDNSSGNVSSNNMNKHSAVQPSITDSNKDEASCPSTPVTPVKLQTENHGQMPSSPAGVNRRTAVLFTRKMQNVAFKKPDTPVLGNTTSSVAGPPSIPSKRKVGRPRKNADSISRCADAAQGSNANHMDKSNSVMSPTIPQYSESFRIYRTGGEIPAETDEETQSDSSCWSCTTSEETSASSGSSLDLHQRSGAESSCEDDGVSIQGSAHSLEPLDLVWAKCRGYPWYPALIINPKMPRTGYLHNGVPIPAPPLDVLALAEQYDEPVYLVLFFDTKRTWQWLPRNKLEPLGKSQDVDQAKLTESRKPTDRKAVRKAYQEAISHRYQVSGGIKRVRTASSGSTDTGVFEGN